MKKLSVVIPTYNERDNIYNLINQIDETLRSIDYEIVFVDDSTDDTPDVIKKYVNNNNHIRLYHRNNKKGLASAVLLGFKKAKGDYIACMDADLQHPASILFPMYVAMEAGADLCIPSRFIPGGSDGGLNWYRKIISWSAKMIGKIILPCLRCISDPTSGLFMFKKEILNGSKMYPIGWKIMVEVIATTKYNTIIEIPYEFGKRISGESKIDIKVTLQYIRQCLGLRSRYIKNNNVMVKRWTPSKTARMLEKYKLI